MVQWKTIGGSKYFFTFINDASRKTFVYFLKSKKSVLDCLKEFKAFAQTQTGKQIKRLRTDNGLEYVNSEMEKFLRESGIHHEKSVPYKPEQTGLAGRMNRTVVVFDRYLEKRFWAEAVATTVFLVNRSPTKGLNVTPRSDSLGRNWICGCSVRRWCAIFQKCSVGSGILNLKPAFSLDTVNNPKAIEFSILGMAR